MSKLIEAIDLETHFHTYEGVVHALNKVSLTIEYGETFGLVGESGCGKSVFVRSLMRIIQEPGKIFGGQVLFYPEKNKNGYPIDLVQQSDDRMRKLRGDQISMIFQEPNAALNPIMNIGDQIAESYLIHRQKEMVQKIIPDHPSRKNSRWSPLQQMLPSLYRWTVRNSDALWPKMIRKIPLFMRRYDRLMRQEAQHRSINMVDKLGIPYAADVVRRYPHELSGGMKQRIVIAIALACQPMLLIADEATSNLDVTIQAQILQLLKKLKETEISSVLLITHDLGIVAETCERVGVMYAGNICEVAHVKDLFASPCHPYTKALLAAVPKFSQEGKLNSIEGNVPNLVTPPPGCRFHPRCPKAQPICRKHVPADTEVGNGHTVACYLYTRQPRFGT